jgi:hypothetical protein
MKMIKSILSMLIALVVLTSSNGFIIEKYLCHGCNQEHNEIAFFEFGEISHEHSDCGECVENHGSCSCHDDDHLKNSKVNYFSLDQLFLKSIKQTNFKQIVTCLVNDFSPVFVTNLRDLFLNKHINLSLKLPPLIASDAGSTVFCAVISVFRF